MSLTKIIKMSRVNHSEAKSVLAEAVRSSSRVVFLILHSCRTTKVMQQIFRKEIGSPMTREELGSFIGLFITLAIFFAGNPTTVGVQRADAPELPMDPALRVRVMEIVHHLSPAVNAYYDRHAKPNERIAARKIVSQDVAKRDVEELLFDSGVLTRPGVDPCDSDSVMSAVGLRDLSNYDHYQGVGTDIGFEEAGSRIHMFLRDLLAHAKKKCTAAPEQKEGDRVVIEYVLRRL